MPNFSACGSLRPKPLKQLCQHYLEGQRPPVVASGGVYQWWEGEKLVVWTWIQSFNRNNFFSHCIWLRCCIFICIQHVDVKTTLTCQHGDAALGSSNWVGPSNLEVSALQSASFAEGHAAVQLGTGEEPHGPDRQDPLLGLKEVFWYARIVV